MVDVGLMYYFAGYVDGEGCFRWNGSTVSASITNTYPAVLQGFQRIWGGSIRSRTKTCEHHKQSYEWEITGQNAAEYARDIGPFLREKRRQANIVAILMWHPKGSLFRDEAIHQLREWKKVEYYL